MYRYKYIFFQQSGVGNLIYEFVPKSWVGKKWSHVVEQYYIYRWQVYLIERKTNGADKHHSKIIVVSVNSTRATYLLEIGKENNTKRWTTDICHGWRLWLNERNELMFCWVGRIMHTILLYYCMTCAVYAYCEGVGRGYYSDIMRCWHRDLSKK